ncbi:AAA family ATPase [Pseudomonas aeruginosa]|uniref:AAA family ATPase n=1 Tax=Pseudomonas aeruginosa TaxID=287 RepID=UPI00106810B0|nr:AAA family ATPase [Pseudomonas aeruginosa]TEC51160.1 hypothetical protein IPC1590_17370 [Pseudomonas aeruginosa]
MHSTHSVGQANSGGSENLQGAQPPLQQAQHPSQYPNGGNLAISAPAPAQPPAWLQQAAERNPHLTPDVAKAEAQAEHMKALAEVQREATKQKELEVQIEEKRVEREKVRQRVQTQPKTIDPNKIKLEFAMSGDTETATVTYLVDPFLPCKCVVGFFGRGGTSKSSFLATMAAMISASASTLWVSSEELTDWIKARHIKAGGAPRTLQVYRGIETDDHSGQQIQVFGVYEHLEAAITMANVAAQNAGTPPVRLVVLDAAVALTIWSSGQSPNDDASVKRLLAYMQTLAEKYDVTIAFIGHNNKRSSQNTEHFEDMVAGAGAWVTSPRVAFVHARDKRDEYSFVMRLAKPQLTPRFLVTYKSEAVHTLAQRVDAPASVLCKAVLVDIVWGEDESARVFDAATGKETEEDTGRALDQKMTTVSQVVEALVQAVHVTHAGQDVTRDMVHSVLKREVNGRRWKDVEDMLRLAQFQYRIDVARGANNQALYRKATLT